MKVKKPILLFLLFITVFCCYGQKTHKILYENGQLKETGQFDLNQKQTGEWKKYYENGNLYYVVNYENGIDKIGEWKYYFPNGLTKRIENYKDGKLNGVYKSYEYNNGKVYLYSIGKYENGQQVGMWKYYFENGQLNEIGNRQDDNRIGKWNEYNKDGKIIFIRYYENGKLIKSEKKW